MGHRQEVLSAKRDRLESAAGNPAQSSFILAQGLGSRPRFVGWRHARALAKGLGNPLAASVFLEENR
jgi:hypothetical protein